MRFEDFEFIPLMLIPSLLLLYLVLTNKSMIERVFDAEVLRRLKLDQGMDKRMRVITLFLALAFMIIALARPIYERGVVEVSKKSANLVVALDISRSMKAKDFYPNRLEFAKKKIEELIKRAENVDIGLLAFAKDAFIVSPVTSDKESLLYLLKHLDTKVLSMQGTNILSALMSAKLLFGEAKEKNILLVTDGGDKKDFKDEIEFAKKEGFKVHILAVATKKGAPLEEDGAFLKDKEGNIVILRLNERIKELARATGGEYVEAVLSNEDIKRILKAIKGYESGKKVERIVDKKELYPYPLALALLFLFLAFFDIGGKRFSFLFLLFFLPFGLKASIIDFKYIKNAKEAYERGAYKEAAGEFEKVAKQKRSPQAYYDLANALYKAGKYKEALKYYSKIQTANKELEFRKLHNLGNTYFKLKNFDKAIEMYEKALKVKDDPDTRYNLELAKKMKKKSSKKNSKKNDKEQKKKQQKKKQQKKGGKNKKETQKSDKKGKNQKPSNNSPKEPKNTPISSREEKKWLKQLKKEPVRTLLYKSPVKVKKSKEGKDENPW